MGFDECAFSECLCVGVGVRPPQGLRTGGPGVDKLGPHPLLAQLLGSDGQDVASGRTKLASGSLGELRLRGITT